MNKGAIGAGLAALVGFYILRPQGTSAAPPPETNTDTLRSTTLPTTGNGGPGATVNMTVKGPGDSTVTVGHGPGGTVVAPQTGFFLFDLGAQLMQLAPRQKVRWDFDWSYMNEWKDQQLYWVTQHSKNGEARDYAQALLNYREAQRPLDIKPDPAGPVEATTDDRK